MSTSRVRITHPRTEAARGSGDRFAAQELDEQTELGEVYMRDLLRRQGRLAVRSCLAVAVLLVGVALVFAFGPAVTAVRVAGVPLPWIVLGVAVYPVLIAIGWLAVRSAEHAEQEFTALLRRRR